MYLTCPISDLWSSTQHHSRPHTETSEAGTASSSYTLSSSASFLFPSRQLMPLQNAQGGSGCLSSTAVPLKIVSLYTGAWLSFLRIPVLTKSPTYQGSVLTGAGNCSFSAYRGRGVGLDWEISLGLVYLIALQVFPGLGSVYCSLRTLA